MSDWEPLLGAMEVQEQKAGAWLRAGKRRLLMTARIC